ncbi:unnamed protein product [Paramecium sonneborni]|uniref:Uncharacterized protein n=1 Tax=Paramecium sonneborni TaxID=65129 RepID=A0A8S1NMJ0_9CILI|nr:unnamed protein product [Paramecium sonneborni]
MNQKELKFQMEAENSNKENEGYLERPRIYKQRIFRIPLIDITDVCYPKRREWNQKPIKQSDQKFSPTIQLR